MRMIVIVTGSILPVTHIDFIVGSLLRLLTGDVSVSLLSHNVVDEPLLGLEVIAHHLRLIRSLSVLEHRSSLLYSRRIGHTSCKDRTAVHVHGNQL